MSPTAAAPPSCPETGATAPEGPESRLLGEAMEPKPPVGGAFRPRTVARNSAWLLVGQALVYASTALLGIVVARRFGTTGYGQYSVAFSFAGVFGLLFSLGADAIVIRDVALARTSPWQAAAPAFWLRLACFPVALAVVGLGAWLAGYPAAQRQIIELAALTIGLGAAADLPRAVFKGLQRMQLDTATRAVEKGGALLLALPALAVLPNATVPTVLWALVGGAAAGLAAGWAIVLHLLGVPRKLDARQAPELARATAPLGGSLAIITLTVQLPVIVLSLLYPVERAGLYNSAYSVVGPFGALPAAFAGALLPPLAALLQSPGAESDRLHRSALGLALAIGLPTGSALAWLAEETLRLLYGPSFSGAAPIMRILAVQIPLSFVSTYLFNLVIAAGRQRLTLLVTSSNLLVAALACALFIPAWGPQGAAIGAVLAAVPGIAIMLVASSRWVRHELGGRPAALLFAGVVVLAGSWVGASLPLAARAAIPAGLGLLALLLVRDEKRKQPGTAIPADTEAP